MDRLQQLQVFRRVVETGNITRAARDLAMNQPSVSRIVGELEHRLGVPLLLRSPRGLSATEAGAAFHLDAVRILDALEEAEAAARGLQGAPTGLVRISCVASFYNAVVMPWLAPFLATHPGLSVEARLQTRAVDLVEEGIDLGIRIGPIRQQSLIARRLGRVDFALFAAPAYLARAGMPATPEELGHHEFCTLRGVRPSDTLILEGPDGASASITMHGRMAADAIETTQVGAEAGLGLALLAPWSVMGQVATGRLVPVLPGWRAQPREVHAVWPGGRALSRRVRAVLDLLVERAAAEPRLKAR